MNIRLNTDQQAAFEAVQRGSNIFLTGPAGSGKSTLVQAIVGWANQERILYSVTAMTACAALLLGCKAKTLHSWAGIGLGRGSVDDLVASIQKTPYAKKRWMHTKILIVDEVSMMTPDLFDKLDAIAKKIRRSARPWGGIQLILCGDFFQLPPVSKGLAESRRFAFDSPAWAAANLTPVLLQRIERQTDRAFQTLLNEARVGALSESSIAILKARQGLDWKSRTIRPTLLFSRNADVDTINEANLAALKKPLHVYEATTVVAKPPEDPACELPTGELLERLITRLDNDASYTHKLELCEGCQVMLVFNMDQEAGLVNGSRGVVVGFRTLDNVPIVQFLHGDPVCIEPHEWVSNDSPAVKRSQIPLRVAYAVTIHKSQGATLDCALVDIGSSTFECGQAYVALSRVRDLDSLYVWNFNPARVQADPRVKVFYEELGAVPAPSSSPRTPTQPAPSPTTDSPSPASPASQPSTPPASPTSSLRSTPREESLAVPLPPRMDASWRPLWSAWLAGGGQAVLNCIEEARGGSTVYPPPEDTYTTFQVPLHGVKVVIVAQDPYHGPGQAMGVAFGVKEGVALPPSLKNIRKEFVSDLGGLDGFSTEDAEAAWPAKRGDLTPWLRQGVFLLNITLTVEKGKANTHSGIGWTSWTHRVLAAILEANPRLVLVAWGKDAQALVKRLPSVREGQHVIEAAHPSPLSASHGFFGSRPFTTINRLLGPEAAVDWKLV